MCVHKRERARVDKAADAQISFDIINVNKKTRKWQLKGRTCKNGTGNTYKDKQLRA